MSKGQGHTGRDSGVLAWWEQRQRGEGAAWGGGASRGPCDPSFQAMSLSHVVIKQVVLNVQGVPAECPADGAPAPTGPSFLPRVLPAHRPPPRWLCLLGAGCAGGPAWRNRWREVGVPAPTLRPALRCLPEDPAGLSPPWSHDSSPSSRPPGTRAAQASVLVLPWLPDAGELLLYVFLLGRKPKAATHRDGVAGRSWPCSACPVRCRKQSREQLAGRT